MSESPSSSPRRVVLLHGVGLDRHVWDEAIARLAPLGYATDALDLLGHGASEPAPPDTTLTDIATPVVSAIEAGVTPVHLVGFSLGALVAQQIAIHRPDLVATLICVNSVCDRTPEEREAVLARLEGAGTDFAAGVQASLRRWFQDTTVSEPARRATEETLLGNDRESYLACYRVFATADAQIAPRLSDITAPTLAITGSDDPGSSPEMSLRLASAVPDCQVQILEDTRHMLPVQRPDEFVAALTAFLEENR